MNTKDNGGPAFPNMPPQDTAAGSATGYPYPDAGMTLRDYFAAKAMQGDIATVMRGHDWVPHVDEFAKHAYAMADAMLKARKE